MELGLTVLRLHYFGLSQVYPFFLRPLHNFFFELTLSFEIFRGKNTQSFGPGYKVYLPGPNLIKVLGAF